jgi:tRNA threonylcarbamoyl adenosine modification protein YjeE
MANAALSDAGMEAGEPTEQHGGWPTHWIVQVDDEAAMVRLASELSQFVIPGDLITLGGGLGVGKTTFARALIRALAGDPALEVPSPTFTLIQTYDGPKFQIVHADLYRVENPRELDGIGWSETSADAVLLVEWAERAGAPLAVDRLDIAFAIDPKRPQARIVTLTGQGALAARLAMAKAIALLLRQAGMSGARREHLQGDASTRAYERLHLAPGAPAPTAILMIAPKRPDGPPVRNGKPYSQIAKLAEDVKPFVAVAKGLAERGFSAPRIYASDLAAGLLVLEDLGPGLVVEDGAPVEERYAEAVAVLAELHRRPLPSELTVENDIRHPIPRADLETMLIEAELMPDWYLPHKGRHALSATARIAFVDLWTRALQPILAQPPTWLLRDYHSPNLVWMPEREGLKRVGLLDFQDCLMGPPAYDVVSLLQDARVDVPDDMELRLLGHYARLRRQGQPGFDVAGFARAYAVMGAQRATKILGIFARLNKRDGKPQYLRHLPRIERNVARCLAHPALADMKQWYEAHLPELFA